MSAACLVDTNADLRDTLISLRTQAAFAIHASIGSALAFDCTPSRVTNDLVFAVFALGTSLNWSTTSRVENPWARTARELLAVWQQDLSGIEKLFHAYFCQALTYWEMLLVSVQHSLILPQLETRQRRHQIRLREALNLPAHESDVPTAEAALPSTGTIDLRGTRPNSWCGISSEVIDIFSQTMSLCHNPRECVETSSCITAAQASNAICDVAVAQDLERELSAMDFDALISEEEALGFSVYTRDDKTPVSHLLQTAEAYRQAALLQLHLRFDNLGTQYLQSREASLLLSTMQLVSTIQQIPTGSGSTSMHPILYLLAAAGLCFDGCSDFCENSRPLEPFWNFDDLDLSSILMQGGQRHTDDSIIAQHGEKQSWSPNMPTVPCRADIIRARHFVWARLVHIQQVMSPRVSKDLLQLVGAIWREFDRPRLGSVQMSWFNILTGFESASILA